MSSIWVNKVAIAHSTILKVDVICLEIDVAKKRLEGSASWPCADERCIVRRRNKENSSLCVVGELCGDIPVIPNMYQITRRCVRGPVERGACIKLPLYRDRIMISAPRRNGLWYHVKFWSRRTRSVSAPLRVTLTVS